MKSRLSLFIFLVLISGNISAQVTADQLDRIDSIFIDWNRPGHPGGTVGIMQDGKIVIQKAYGLASLEYMVPNAVGTQYNIASVSKQFTGMAMVLLEQRGVLSLEDDIRKHLPWVPDFGQTITIRHMLNHTSGLRSLHALLSLAGWRGDDTRTNEDINRFVRDQRELNFEPGSEYLYCNTGFMLLATLVEEKTGESFADWMTANVFEPLGMNRTYVEAQYNRVAPGNATSYNGSASSEFSRAVEYWGYVGSGNMHSTTSDMLSWLHNFSEPKKGWEDAFKRMVETVDFNNGEPQSYALGIGVNDYYGHRRIGHGGSIGGFRSQIQTFPEDKLSIVVLTNFSSANPGGKLNRIANILLDVTPEPGPQIEEKPERTYDPSKSDLENIQGMYFSPEIRTTYEFKITDEALVAYHNRHGDMPVEWLAADEFRVRGALGTVKIIRNRKGRVTGVRASNGRVRNLLFEKQ